MAHFTCNFLSYTFDRAVMVDVIVPSMTSTEAEAADASHRIRHRYPVLYLLHGYCNDYSTWERYTSVERYAEERRIAVVTFSAENNYYLRLSDFMKYEGKQKLFSPDYMRFVQKELPEFVTSMFPISRRRDEKYIAGLSMGGFGAMLNGFSASGKYRAVGAFSPMPTLCSCDFGDFSQLDRAERKAEPALLLERLVSKNARIPAFYYSYGNKDFLLDKQQWFKKKLDELGVEYKFNNVETLGHEWEFWDQEIKNFLDWIPRSDPYYLDAPIRNI